MGAGSLLYISNGNIPSRWAHTVQTMKMSEALAQLVPEFRLLIASSLRDMVRPRVDLWRWYGIRQPFRVTKLPLWLWRSDPVFVGVREPRFSRMAPIFAARAHPALVWTRSYPIADGCLQRGLPVVFERHSATPAKFAPVLARMGASPALRAFITNSEELAPAHVAAGIPAAKIAAFANGVELPLGGTRPDAAQARRALGLPGEGKIALYAGSLSEAKGMPTLLAAAARVPDVRFEVLGGGEADVARWRAEAPHNVMLRGFVPHAQLADWLAAADVGLFPNSARDPIAASTSPLKVLEYVAAGLPVVAAAIPAVASWLRDGENAFLHAPDDPAALATTLRRALEDPAAARACADRARTAQRGQTWRARAEQILARFAPELLRAGAA